MSTDGISITGCSFSGLTLKGDAAKAISDIAEALKANAEALKTLSSALSAGEVNIDSVISFDKDSCGSRAKTGEATDDA